MLVVRSRSKRSEGEGSRWVSSAPSPSAQPRSMASGPIWLARCLRRTASNGTLHARPDVSIPARMGNLARSFLMFLSNWFGIGADVRCSRRTDRAFSAAAARCPLLRVCLTSRRHRRSRQVRCGVAEREQQRRIEGVVHDQIDLMALAAIGVDDLARHNAISSREEAAEQTGPAVKRRWSLMLVSNRSPVVRFTR